MTKKLILLAPLLLTACIVAPPPTASGETMSSYNALIIGLYSLIATSVLTIIGQFINIWISKHAAKKADDAIVAANHQNEKLMKLTETQMKLTESLAETDKKAASEASTKGAPASSAPPVPIILVVPATPVAAVQVPLASAAPTPVEVVQGAGISEPLKVDQHKDAQK